MDNTDYLVDFAILRFSISRIEEIIEGVFNRFTNDDFEHLTPVAFVYKRTIRFVPIELKELVEVLLKKREEMLQMESEDTIKTR